MFIRTFKNVRKSFIFAHILLLEDYEQVALRKEPVIATLIEQFKIATSTNPYR